MTHEFEGGQIGHPNQFHPTEDEYGPQQDGPQDAVEQHLVLQGLRDIEEMEHEDEHKKVVHRQGLFDPISALKLRKGLHPHGLVNQRAEPHRKPDPDGRPAQGLAVGDGVAAPVE